jgi:hypothetical protein
LLEGTISFRCWSQIVPRLEAQITDYDLGLIDLIAACHGADDGDGGQQKLGFPKIPINPHSPDIALSFGAACAKASIICYLVLASAVHFLNVEASLA